MAYTDAQIRTAVQQTYEHVNATVYDGRLPAWGTFTFSITDSTRRLGCVHAVRPRYADFGPKVIGLDISRRCNTLAALADTVRHEIAHVASISIDGQMGHGYTWQRHAVKCGAEPRHCSIQDFEAEPGDYVLSCQTEGCGKTYLYKKRTKNVERAARGELRAKCNRCSRYTVFTAHRHV